MRRSLNVLDDIRVASPCPVAWDRMAGDDRKRHCSQCHQPVYDLSALTTAEAVDLLNAGSACVRLYRRADGKVITRDCPEGRALRLRRTARRVVLAFATWLGFGLVTGCRDGPRCTQGEASPPPSTRKAAGAEGEAAGK